MKYCIKLNLKRNLNASEIIEFKDEENCYIYGQRLEVVKVIYLGVKLEGLGEWRRKNV